MTIGGVPSINKPWFINPELTLPSLNIISFGGSILHFETNFLDLWPCHGKVVRTSPGWSNPNCIWVWSKIPGSALSVSGCITIVGFHLHYIYIHKIYIYIPTYGVYYHGYANWKPHLYPSSVNL